MLIARMCSFSRGDVDGSRDRFWCWLVCQHACESYIFILNSFHICHIELHTMNLESTQCFLFCFDLKHGGTVLACTILSHLSLV
jgi:hypothetical protein